MILEQSVAPSRLTFAPTFLIASATPSTMSISPLDWSSGTAKKFQCDGGDSASDQGRGKGRQLATSGVAGGKVKMLFL